MSDLRVGLGVDAHAFSDDAPLVLGGVDFPGEPGLAGHSDGDVVAHARHRCIAWSSRPRRHRRALPLGGSSVARCLVDAPPSAGLRGGEGRRLRARQRGLRAHRRAAEDRAVRDAMRARLAGAMGVAPEQVAVRATTTDRLGFTGRGEGLAAQAVVLLVLVSPDRLRQAKLFLSTVLLGAAVSFLLPFLVLTVDERRGEGTGVELVTGDAAVSGTLRPRRLPGPGGGGARPRPAAGRGRLRRAPDRRSRPLDSGTKGFWVGLAAAGTGLLGGFWMRQALSGQQLLAESHWQSGLLACHVSSSSSPERWPRFSCIALPGPI